MSDKWAKVSVDVEKHPYDGTQLGDGETDHKTSSRRPVLSIIFALGAFFLFGITNFLFGLVSELSDDIHKASLSSAILSWSGLGFMFVIACGFFVLSGRGFKGIPRKSFIFLCLIAGLTLGLGKLFIILALSFDPTSRGAVLALVACGSIVVAMMSRLLLKEKLNGTQFVGIGISVVGLALMAFVNSAAGWTAFLWGALCMLSFSTTNTILKIVGHFGMNSITATVIVWAGTGTMGVIGIIVTAAMGTLNDGLEDSVWQLIVPVVAGITLGLGLICLKIAVTIGEAGPAVAISLSNGILVVTLDVLILGYRLDVLKTVGMLITLAGVVVLSIAPIIKRFMEKRRMEKKVVPQ
eukprot:TRINITY_DN82405_c0_g1_i1.p1 TRINITY_DN82405_c0_g1~~TRINITY_DN82405_c0_g1_i1.p1  ORF type:complete len:352 (+),score=82.45 TRINITY_DN82405_c0_g1_i1:108-1163(+)